MRQGSDRSELARSEARMGRESNTQAVVRKLGPPLWGRPMTVREGIRQADRGGQVLDPVLGEEVHLPLGGPGQLRTIAGVVGQGPRHRLRLPERFEETWRAEQIVPGAAPDAAMSGKNALTSGWSIRAICRPPKAGIR